MAIDLRLARFLYHRAYSHALSAHDLAELQMAEAIRKGAADVEDETFSGRRAPSVHLLIGNALELMLKVGFLLHGGDPEELPPGNGGIGHDLRKALKRAEALGFRSAVSNLHWIVDSLRDSHFSHQFRYGDLEKIPMPALDETLPALETLSRELFDQLQAVSD